MLRRPDGYLEVQGQRVHVLSLEVHLTREAKSDTMHAVLAMSYLPDGLPLAWWCETAPIEVEAYFTADGEAGEPLFTGTLTQVEPNWTARTLDVRGHDKTTDLMEARTPDAHRNKTGQEVIEAIAKKHGLTVRVAGGTQKAGRQYDIDHVHLGEVTSYNDDTHAVKVRLQPEGKETGWMPLGAIHVGNGFGIAVGANEGDQVIVGFLDGEALRRRCGHRRARRRRCAR